MMISGIGTMPAIIAQDRANGLFLKLRSMPVQQWKDSIGRIFGLLFYVLISAVIISVIGVVMGARFNFTVQSAFISLGFLVLAILGSAGAGIIIGTFVKNINAAVLTGIGISVVTMSLAGVTFPYSFLPGVLQTFSRFYPFSSSNSIISFMLSTEAFVGYNPMSTLQIVYTVAVSLVLFIVSLLLYSRFCWRTE